MSLQKENKIHKIIKNIKENPIKKEYEYMETNRERWIKCNILDNSTIRLVNGDIILIKNQINTGSYGNVYHGYHQIYKDVAIKIFKCNEISGAKIHIELSKVIKELPKAYLLEKIKIDDNNYGYNKIPDIYCFIMELCFPVKNILYYKTYKFIKDIMIILSKLHQYGIYHYDIKPDNIVINKKHNYTLIDFDLTNVSHDIKQFYMICTRWYKPIEIIKNIQPCDEGTIDIWSFGCSLIELVCKQTLFPGKDINNQSELINHYFNMEINDRIKYITSFFNKILINKIDNKEYLDDTKTIITNIINLLINIFVESENRYTSIQILEIINEYQ